MKRYWYTTCPNCKHQGRLMVMKNLSSWQLYLHCEECESGWHDPLKVDDSAARFLTLDEDFEADPASLDDMEKAGWQRYAMNIAAD